MHACLPAGSDPIGSPGVLPRNGLLFLRCRLWQEKTRGRDLPEFHRAMSLNSCVCFREWCPLAGIEPARP